MHIGCRWGFNGVNVNHIVVLWVKVMTLYSEHWMAQRERIANYTECKNESHDKTYCFGSRLLTHRIPVKGLALCGTLPIPVNMARSHSALRGAQPQNDTSWIVPRQLCPISALYRISLFFIDYDTGKLSSNLIKRRLVVSLTFSNPIAAVLSQLSFSTLVAMSILETFDTFVYASGTPLVK